MRSSSTPRATAPHSLQLSSQPPPPPPNVALYLSDRYERLGEMIDLNEAIILGRQALDPYHPDRLWSLHQLADCLRVLFTQSRKLKDREDAFSFYTELINISQTVSPADISAGKGWITVAEDFRHPTMLLAYETTLRLLVQHLAILPPLPSHLQTFKDLASSLTINAFSACLPNQRTRKPVELLEQGRGVFWNQITHLRPPLEEVITSGQEGEALANEFTRLSSEIHNTIHPQGPDQHNRLCSLHVDLQSVITKIRNLPGLARFLLPGPSSYDGRGQGESGRGDLPGVGDAVCKVPVCDWDDVGRGRRTDEQDHVHVLREHDG